MTYSIPPESPRKVQAELFARELSKAMLTRKVGARTVAKAIGNIGRSSIVNWKTAQALPRMESAEALATALRWPKLEELIRQARTVKCQGPGCDIEFIHNLPTRRSYHSIRCQRLAERARHLSGVRSRVDHDNITRGLAQSRSAVAAFCRGCEPEGSCHQPKCALRAISPLPLVELRQFRSVAPANPAPGPYGTAQNRAKTIAAVKAASQERWTPEEREHWRIRLAGPDGDRMRAAARKPEPIALPSTCPTCGQSMPDRFEAEGR